jgi:hypothetical protein
MAHYAHTLLEHNDRRYQPGDVVPDDLPGLEALVAAGSVSTEPFTRQVTVDGAGRVLGDGPQVARFNGDFTPEQIIDTEVDTPLLGIHRNATELREQEPDAYDAGEASA